MYAIRSYYEDGTLPAGFLGGTGIFTTIIVGIYVTELMRFLKVSNIGIKLPEQVPEKIRQSFNLLIPALVVILTIYPLNLFLQHEFGMMFRITSYNVCYTKLLRESHSPSGNPQVSL